MSGPRKVADKPRGRYPWEKAMVDLNKFDWQIAIGLSKHRGSPRDLRVAAVIARLADLETNFVWATQETIALLSGLADVRQVRAAIKRLEGGKDGDKDGGKGGGALKRTRISQLQPDMIEALDGKMNGRNARGVVYKLSMFWAYEIFEAYGKTSNPEPAQLRKGKASKRTTPVRYERTTPVRLNADCVSPAYIEDNIPSDIRRGSEGEKDLASTREGQSYATATGRAA